jgi:hypothetical protein
VSDMRMARSHRFDVVPDQNTRLASPPIRLIYIGLYDRRSCRLPLSRFGDPKPTARRLLTAYRLYFGVQSL